MIKKNFTNINLIILGVILFLSIGFIIKNIYDIKQLNNDIHAQRVELEKKYETGQSLKETIQILKEIEPRLTKLDNSLLPANNTLKFINDLENTADKYNLQQIIKLADFEKDNNKIITTPLQLSITGNYGHLFAYLAELDKKPYYINIHKLIINSQSNGLSGKKITASIEAEIYWQ